MMRNSKVWKISQEGQRIGEESATCTAQYGTDPYVTTRRVAIAYTTILTHHRPEARRIMGGVMVLLLTVGVLAAGMMAVVLLPIMAVVSSRCGL